MNYNPKKIGIAEIASRGRGKARDPNQLKVFACSDHREVENASLPLSIGGTTPSLGQDVVPQVLAPPVCLTGALPREQRPVRIETGARIVVL